MFLPDAVSQSYSKELSQQSAAAAGDWQSTPPFLPASPTAQSTVQPTYDPGMDGKVAVLKQMMAPEWGGTLNAYGAANDAAGGDTAKGVARLMPSAVSALQSTPGVISEDWGGSGAGGVAGMLGSVNPAAALGAIAQFLPPEEQKAAAAAGALLQGNPIGAVMAVLPPEAQAAASVALPLAMGDLDGSLMALAGKFMPPELQPVFSAFMQMGGLSGVLGIKLPQLPSPFVKPKPPSQPEADLSTDPGAECGVQPKAARITDTRACPRGSGPIFTGQMNVLIGFMPAARIGDKGVCIGPPDVITDGEPTVSIGGSPASRLADSTAHGGFITTGYSTVLIGKSHAPCVKIAAARRAAIIVNGPSA